MHPDKLISVNEVTTNRETKLNLSLAPCQNSIFNAGQERVLPSALCVATVHPLN